MKSSLSVFCLVLCLQTLGQCPYVATLASQKDYCTGSPLYVTSRHGMSKLVWYKDGKAVDSAFADQHFASSAVTVVGAGSGAQGSQYIEPSSVYVDDDLNIYTADNKNFRLLKWVPGASDAVVAAGGNGYGTEPDQLDYAGGIYVDDAKNVYVADEILNRVVKWSPGASSGEILFTIPKDWPYDPVWGKHIRVDCQGTVYFTHDTVVYSWSPGSSVFSKAAVAQRLSPNGNLMDMGAPSLDGNGNLFVYSSIYGMVKYVLGNPLVATVTGATGSKGFQPAGLQDFYVDGSDTFYMSDIEYVFLSGGGQIANGRIVKWWPGATQEQIIFGGNGAGNGSDQLNEPGSICMDIRGNLYVIDINNERIQKIPRISVIDSTYTPTGPGRYYAVMTDLQGYQTTTNMVLINTPQAGPPSIVVDASATSANICTPISFSASEQNGGLEPSYQWEVSGVKVGIDSPGYAYNLFADGDQVYCIMTSQLGCTATMVSDTSNLVTLHIDPKGAATVAIAVSKDPICKGDTTTFTATVTNGSVTPVFTWLLNGATTTDQGAIYQGDQFANGDVLTCLITSDDVCGLAKSNSITLHVYDPPTVGMGQVFSIPYGRKLDLDPVVAGNIASCTWTPATGLSNPGILDPVADPSTNTLYTLHVVSPGGCTDSGTILVNVYTPLSMPGAFTPNGDGHNDVFYVLGGPEGSLIEDFMVFNRWGQQVFHVHDGVPGDRSYGWDGRVHGEMAPPGTYVYEVAMKYPDGRRQLYKGTVILIR